MRSKEPDQERVKNQQTETMKLESMDDVCNEPAGSFKKFIEKKEAHLQNLEKQRKARIRASRKAAWDMVIAA